MLKCCLYHKHNSTQYKKKIKQNLGFLLYVLKHFYTDKDINAQTVELLTWVTYYFYQTDIYHTS